MVIRAGRDVLYSRNRQSIILALREKDEAPLNNPNQKNRGYPCPLMERGSLTVEAAFSGTIFFLVLFALLYLFQMLERYNDVQVQLASSVHQYECYGMKKLTLRDARGEVYAVGWNEDSGVCHVRRREEIPFLGSSFFHVNWYQQMKFNSYQGRSMAARGQEEGEYVYLAEHGSVYHRSAGCVYLKPSVRQTTYVQLERERNLSGERYDPCSSCGKNAHPAPDAPIYVASYGDSWHTRRDCTHIQRSPRRVRIEEVGGLPPCSKCGGG